MLGSLSSNRMIFLLGKKAGPSADFEKVKGRGRGHYLKEILILNFFEDKDPRFTRLKSGLALRLLVKGLFFII